MSTLQQMTSPLACREAAQGIADAGVESNYGAGIIYALIAVYGALERIAERLEAVSFEGNHTTLGYVRTEAFYKEQG